MDSFTKGFKFGLVLLAIIVASDLLTKVAETKQVTSFNNTNPVVNSITINSTTFAALGTPANGVITYCSDCTVTTPASCPATQASCVCAASGTGAFARRVAAAWYCTF